MDFYRMLLALLEYAIVDTEAVAKILSSAETSAWERRILSFLATLRDLLAAACALAEAESALGVQQGRGESWWRGAGFGQYSILMHIYGI